MFGLLRRKIAKDAREIIINDEMLETRVAVLDKGRLVDFKIEHPTEERIVGSIYKGVVQNLENSLHAAFVDIGLKKNAFIHYWDMFPEDIARLEAIEGDGNSKGAPPRRRQVSAEQVAKAFPKGSEIVVQVTKGSIGSKGPRVTTNISIPSRFFVMMPGSSLRGISRKIEDERERKRLKKILTRLPIPDGIGLIIRTAGAGAKSTSFVRDLRSLLEAWQLIQAGIRDKAPPSCLYQEPDLIERTIRDSVTDEVDSIVIDSAEQYKRIQELMGRIARRVRGRIKHYDGAVPVFQHFNIEKQLADVFRRKVSLKSGGCIVFDETEALIAIDVNTGQHRGARSQEDAILEVNLEAVEEVSRQLRLRNVGGLVVLDLIDMKSKKNRNQVYHALKEALRKDKARTNVLPISSLGLLEMTRQRVDESVESSMYDNCPYCRGRGSVKSGLSMSVEIQRHIAEVMRRHAHDYPDGLPLRVIVNPSVLNRFREEDEDVLVNLENKFHGHFAFRGDPARHVEEFSIQHAETNEVLYTHQYRGED